MNRLEQVLLPFREQIPKDLWETMGNWQEHFVAILADALTQHPNPITRFSRWLTHPLELLIVGLDLKTLQLEAVDFNDGGGDYWEQYQKRGSVKDWIDAARNLFQTQPELYRPKLWGQIDSLGEQPPEIDSRTLRVWAFHLLMLFVLEAEAEPPQTAPTPGTSQEVVVLSTGTGAASPAGTGSTAPPDQSQAPRTRRPAPPKPAVDPAVSQPRRPARTQSSPSQPSRFARPPAQPSAASAPPPTPLDRTGISGRSGQFDPDATGSLEPTASLTPVLVPKAPNRFARLTGFRQLPWVVIVGGLLLVLTGCLVLALGAGLFSSSRDATSIPPLPNRQATATDQPATEPLPTEIPTAIPLPTDAPATPLPATPQPTVPQVPTQASPAPPPPPSTAPAQLASNIPVIPPDQFQLGIGIVYVLFPNQVLLRVDTDNCYPRMTAPGEFAAQIAASAGISIAYFRLLEPQAADPYYLKAGTEYPLCPAQQVS